MTGADSSVLYSPALLALAVELAEVPFDGSAPMYGKAISRTCGSRVELSGTYDNDSGFGDIGLRVSACAVGQASAAIFAKWIINKCADDVERAYSDLNAWLDDARSKSSIPRLALLDPARTYRSRHEAILLPWRAARDALCKAKQAG